MPEEVLGGEMKKETNLVPLPQQQLGELALIGQIRQMLVEARTLPDFRHVMERAAAITDNAKRAAKLMEAQGMAAEIVQQATEAANDAAVVRIEAQAGAGKILRQMGEAGTRVTEKGTKGLSQADRDRVHQMRAEGVPVTKIAKEFGRSPEYIQNYLRDVVSDNPKRQQQPEAKTNADLGLSSTQVSRWAKVADIPEETRQAYVDETKREGGEITTAGLLRYAKPPSEPAERTNLEVAYDDVVRALQTIIAYDPGIIFGHASITKRRTKFRELLNKAEAWVDRAKKGYGDDG